LPLDSPYGNELLPLTKFACDEVLRFARAAGSLLTAQRFEAASNIGRAVTTLSGSTCRVAASADDYEQLL
jgi:hypothetical protein